MLPTLSGDASRRIALRNAENGTAAPDRSDRVPEEETQHEHDSSSCASLRLPMDRHGKICQNLFHTFRAEEEKEGLPHRPTAELHVCTARSTTTVRLKIAPLVFGGLDQPGRACLSCDLERAFEIHRSTILMESSES
jgi:hypothetical protein